MSLFTLLLLVTLLSGPCIPQSQTEEELIVLTLKSIDARQDSVRQQFDGLEGKLLAQHERLEGKLLAKHERLEGKLWAQREQLANLKFFVGGCSTKDQVNTFHDFLATDECERKTNCSIHATCRDSQCSCMAGYSGDGVLCEDIDECTDDTNVCGDEQICVNLPGNYRCICMEGYEKQGAMCQDIDECSAENKCSVHASCTNIPGGFTCMCSPGREGDGYTCRPNGFVCTFPSFELKPFGCIKYVKEKMSWSEAQANCNADGGSLLYGFTTKQQFVTIVQHVKAYYSSMESSPWVGVQGGLFVKSPSDDGPPGGTSPSPAETHLWRTSWGIPQVTLGDNTQCGFLDIYAFDLPNLREHTCSVNLTSLCQILY